jgi:predicted transposase YdaD
MLRPEANATNLSGTLVRSHSDGKQYLRFDYDVIRVWELPCEPLLASGSGTAPLALLTDEASGRLPELVSRMDRKMRDANSPESERKLVLASTYLLMGLRYNEEEIRAAFLGVQGMKESTTYQAILREGRDEGVAIGRDEGVAIGREEGQKIGISQGLVIARRDTLLAILRDRFPNVPADVKSQIEDCAEVDRLQKAILRAIHIDRIEDLNL